MIIRAAKQTELEQVRACARAAYQPYVAAIGREPAPMSADFAGALKAGTLDVAEAQTTLAGFIISYKRGAHWHIENIAVVPALQGRGIGQALLAHGEKLARANGALRLALYTNEKMTANLTWYPRQGYHEVRRAVEDGFSRVFFEKSL